MLFTTETFALDASKVKRTATGCLLASPRIARTGIQEYYLKELADEEYATKVIGMDEYNPDQVIRVNRPEEVVLADETMQSFTGMPITVGHPPQSVTADNWKEYAVGDTGEEAMEDAQTKEEKKKGLKYIRVPMMLRDSDAVNLVVNKGVKELSVGYGMVLDWKPGTDAQGNDYDTSVKRIKGNHLAIVPKARGGSKLKIGDSRDGRSPDTMDDMVTMAVDGITVTVSQKDKQILDKHIAGLQEALTSTSDENKTLKETITTKDGEIVALKKQVEDSAISPEKLNALVADRKEVEEIAEDVLGGSDERKYTTTESMQREVVTKYMGDAAADMSDEQIKLTFDGIKATRKAMDEDDEGGMTKKRKKAMDDHAKDAKARVNPLLAPVKDSMTRTPGRSGVVAFPSFGGAGSAGAVTAKDAADLLESMNG